MFSAFCRQANIDDVVTLSDINNGRKRKDERVIVVDVIGELFKVYSLAIGCLLRRKPGAERRPEYFEAAAWGKVIFYGPSMEDFAEKRLYWKMLLRV
ncbi:MAG: hypothetical protein M0C28_25890 [Candidatus Moduliflexus flocculans]|nr:hypothetical protein [Candidatus Moduliflexus flocculans]